MMAVKDLIARLDAAKLQAEADARERARQQALAQQEEQVE